MMQGSGQPSVGRKGHSLRGLDDKKGRWWSIMKTSHAMVIGIRRADWVFCLIRFSLGALSLLLCLALLTAHRLHSKWAYLLFISLLFSFFFLLDLVFCCFVAKEKLPRAFAIEVVFTLTPARVVLGSSLSFFSSISLLSLALNLKSSVLIFCFQGQQEIVIWALVSKLFQSAPPPTSSSQKSVCRFHPRSVSTSTVFFFAVFVVSCRSTHHL